MQLAVVDVGERAARHLSPGAGTSAVRALLVEVVIVESLTVPPLQLRHFDAHSQPSGLVL